MYRHMIFIFIYFFQLYPLWTDDDSLSEEEQGPLVLDQTWRGDPDSEADSLDSDHEDPLK